MHRLVLDVGIEKQKNLRFRKKGNIRLACPKCGLNIEINIEGLEENECLSPMVNWREEWDTNYV